jgi:acyl-CoA synthetase (AMP-forming)/AMP-acid ligase II
MEIPNFNFFWKYVEYWASVIPNETALVFKDQKINYRQLNQITDTLAKAFLKFGVKKGDRIVTVLPSCPEFVYTFIASSKVDAITVPMDVRYKVADFKKFLSHVEPKIVIAMSKFRDNNIAENIKPLLSNFKDTKFIMIGDADFGTSFNNVISQRLDFDDELKMAKVSQNVDDDILIVFTGGTTGVPKAALLSHKNVTNMCKIECEVLLKFLSAKGFRGRLKNLAALPPSHVGGTLELIGTGIVGGQELILLDHWSPYPVLEITQRERLPLIAGVPTMFAILLSLPDLSKYDLTSVKVAVLSGEKVSLELLTKIKEKICDTIIIGYGTTEAGAEVTFTDLSDDINKLAEGYVGKPLPGVEIKIVDENDNPLPPGKVGEILVRSPFTSKGYFRQPEETKESFTADGFHRTGDLGYLTENNELYIVGRKKFIIRVGSYTVLPTEVEEVVLKHPKVAMAAAIGVPHEIYGEVVWLFVSPKPGTTIDENELIELCKRELADFKVPRKVIIQESLPLTRIGKADRIKLKEEVLKFLKEHSKV